MEMFRNRLAGGVPGIVERCTFWGEQLDYQVRVGAEGEVRSRPAGRRNLPPALFKTHVVPRGCCQLEAWFTRRPDLIAQFAAMRFFGDCAWPFCIFAITLAGSGHDLPLQRQRGVKKILTDTPQTDCKPAARKFGCVPQKNDTVTGMCQKFFLYLEFI